MVDLTIGRKFCGKSLVGQKYGRLTVVEFAGRDKWHKAHWKCVCDCGETITVLCQSLIKGGTASCGCIRQEFSGKDLSGIKFGKLAVISYAGKTTRRQSLWLCKCECGTEKVIPGNTLKNGESKSCGCSSFDFLSSQNCRSHTKEFSTWRAMLYRCYKETDRTFDRYGGRGIKVCDSWRESFHAFLKDMGEAPSKVHSIGRINNDGDYCPENCRWETRSQQANNTSRNVNIAYEGKTQTVKQWAVELGIDYKFLWKQINDGFPPEIAFKKRPKELQTLTLNGETKTILDWSAELGIKAATIRAKVRRGLSDEDALRKP